MGSTAEVAGATCNAIMDDGSSTGDGVYWIDLGGDTPFQAYCGACAREPRTHNTLIPSSCEPC